jgi:hypothetical protein
MRQCDHSKAAGRKRAHREMHHVELNPKAPSRSLGVVGRLNGLQTRLSGVLDDANLMLDRGPRPYGHDLLKECSSVATQSFQAPPEWRTVSASTFSTHAVDLAGLCNMEGSQKAARQLLTISCMMMML